MFWILFTHPSSGVKWTAESTELVRSMSLDIQILDTAIWLWSKHLKTSRNQFLLGFKCSTPLNLPTHYLGCSFFSYLMYVQKIFKTLDFWFIDTWNNIDRFVSFQKDARSIPSHSNTNTLTFEYKIHSVEVDLYYFKNL